MRLAFGVVEAGRCGGGAGQAVERRRRGGAAIWRALWMQTVGGVGVRASGKRVERAGRQTRVAAGRRLQRRRQYGERAGWPSRARSARASRVKNVQADRRSPCIFCGLGQPGSRGRGGGGACWRERERERVGSRPRAPASGAGGRGARELAFLAQQALRKHNMLVCKGWASAARGCRGGCPAPPDGARRGAGPCTAAGAGRARRRGARRA